MTISNVTATQVANFANVDTSETIDMGIITDFIMPSAKKHLADYMAVKVADLDEYEDITIAYLCLCAYLFDNRTMTSDNPNMNVVIESFINKHGGALL